MLFLLIVVWEQWNLWFDEISLLNILLPYYYHLYFNNDICCDVSVMCKYGDAWW